MSTVAGGSKENLIEMNGTVIEKLYNDAYNVQLENGENIKAYRSGKLRMYYVILEVGDRVTVQIDPDNNSAGRITYRFKK
ncbi:MAG: translation initiation factor IF-1 [Erysipelotrichaceae bacterium]|nr:translation initiation factor IF-1 [Erysipelotrichaceae bacterium]